MPNGPDEVRILIEEGAVLHLEGTLDPLEWAKQAMLGLACSALLNGRLVLLRDWLPGLDVECHGSMLTQGGHMPQDCGDELREWRTRICWWLDLPTATAPSVYSLQTCAGLLRMHQRRLAPGDSDQAMRLVCDWGAAHLPRCGT